MPRLFALDQNYPEPIAEDWQVLQALHLHGRDWDGLITSDKNMLGLPKELAVLCQTKLTLVVAVAAGHDPIKATGLLLTHLGSICEQTRADSAQVWTLRTARKAPEDPWIHMTHAAARQDISADTLYRRERLTGDDLAADPLG